VSVTEINIKPAQQRITIACKMFTDDLQEALYKLYNSKVDLTKASVEQELLLQRYMNERFQIKVDDLPTQLKVVGFETAEEATWCYLEGFIPSNNKSQEVSVNSTILCDFLPTQANLIHCRWDASERKSYKLDCGNSYYQFVFKK
jgi:hypothetical protein